MSLCVLIQGHGGNVLMAADTALSVKIDGQTYRAADKEDGEKLIVVDKTLIFCSGDYRLSCALREYMQAMPTLDFEAIGVRACELAEELEVEKPLKDSDTSTSILAVLPDGTRVTLQHISNFKPEYEKNNVSPGNIYYATAGANRDKALAVLRAIKDWDLSKSLEYIEAAYTAALCESVGGHIHLYNRDNNGQIQHLSGTFNEPETIRRAYAAPDMQAVKRGIIQAKDFLLHDGTSMVSILNKNHQIKADWLDLMGLNITNDVGDTMMTISQDGIQFGDRYAPVKYQFAVSISGPWHSTMQSGDKYRRDSLDSGKTWGTPYQFKGTDGQNGRDGKDGKDGSDAKVPEYIHETYIGPTEIRAPTIKANNYYIFPEDADDETGEFTIYGMYNGRQHEMFKIKYSGRGDFPEVKISSPASSDIQMGDGSARIIFAPHTLDLSRVKTINWGDNAPTAVFA